MNFLWQNKDKKIVENRPMKNPVHFVAALKKVSYLESFKEDTKNSTVNGTSSGLWQELAQVSRIEKAR